LLVQGIDLILRRLARMWRGIWHSLGATPELDTRLIWVELSNEYFYYITRIEKESETYS
jgi:hypothetical protein